MKNQTGRYAFGQRKHWIIWGILGVNSYERWSCVVANEIFEDSSPVGKKKKYFVDGCFDNILSFPGVSAYERGDIGYALYEWWVSRAGANDGINNNCQICSWTINLL